LILVFLTVSDRRAVPSSGVPRALLLAAVAALAAACGGSDDLADELRDLPGVVSVEEHDTDHEGYRYFELQFDQPVDHADPGGAHFRQEATLIHRDVAAPMVMLHTGYGNWQYDYPSEPTRLLGANQLAVEHRFFRGSRPAGAAAWAFLDIAQSAADHHTIRESLGALYGAAWIETGASKGGMTSVFHRRFFPTDVDGTVAYVAPLSLAAPDYRYDAQLEQVGPPACRQAVRDLQVEMLTNRRAALEQRATAEASAMGFVYTRVALPPAVESAIVSLEWAFWQYQGVAACATLPATTAADGALWTFLREVSPVSGSSDDELAEFEAYYYQAESELGYPGTMDEHLDGLLLYGEVDYAGAYPAGVTIPPYSDAAMRDVDAWVQAEGERLIFVYGEWDPWSGGMFELGAARDSLRVVAPEGFHGAGIADLAAADRTAVLDRLGAWSGVTPDTGGFARSARARPPILPRVPPAIWRATALRHLSPAR
jgi:hypothetical protein